LNFDTLGRMPVWALCRQIDCHPSPAGD
jgi:hypothetical protein